MQIKFKKGLVLLTLITLMFTALAITASAASDPIIQQRADPHIFKHTDGYYYYTASVPEYNRIILRRATTIQGLATAQETVIWWAHPSGEMSSHIWAPEIHHIDGKWYIYFAAGGDDVWAIRSYVLENSSANPLTGSWVEKGKIQMNFESFTLDATTFTHNGTRYLSWAQKVGNDSNIYIAAMSNPWTISGTQVMIATPQYSWETEGHRVNEGPSVIKRNGRVFMSYSASATDDRYKIGLLTASDTSNLLNANSWSKNPNPVFQSSVENSQYGPGHNSFTVSENGSTDILVYHARTYKNISGEPLYDPNRHTYVQTLNWNSDGTPNFGVPGGSTSSSGIVSGNTYNLVNVSSGKALDVWNAGTANGTNVAIYTHYNNSSQKWTVTQHSDGTYKLINPNSGKALDVNGFGTANGTNVQIWQDYNNGAQKWSIIQNSDGSYRLINPNSNKALDAAGTSNGDNVLIWDYWGGSNQKWNFVPAN